jgi:hypothetical protein
LLESGRATCEELRNQGSIQTAAEVRQYHCSNEFFPRMIEENALRLPKVNSFPCVHDVVEAPLHAGSNTIEHLAFLMLDVRF